MSAAIIVGTTKGIFGLSNNTVTGLVIDSIDFKAQTNKHEFLDINADPTAMAYEGHTMGISIKGRLLSGTAFAVNVAEALSLTTIPATMPTGYTTGGTIIIESIDQSETIKDWQSLSIEAVSYPKVV